MIAAPVEKIVTRRSVDFQEEIKPTTAARITAGPTARVGSTAYIIAARKINVPATDLSLWLTPSALPTETGMRAAAKVKGKRSASGVSPVQPVRRQLAVETRE